MARRSVAGSRCSARSRPRSWRSVEELAAAGDDLIMVDADVLLLRDADVLLLRDAARARLAKLHAEN